MSTYVFNIMDAEPLQLFIESGQKSRNLPPHYCGLRFKINMLQFSKSKKIHFSTGRFIVLS